jgi:hypothetical protein
VTLYEWDKDSGKGVLGSKATGEPAVHMGVSTVLALRKAIDAARTTILNKDPKDWYPLCEYRIDMCAFVIHYVQDSTHV